MDRVASLAHHRERLTKLFTTSFIGQDGFPVFAINSETGVTSDATSLIAELGDYLPFLLYYGEGDFCDEQLVLVERFFSRKKPFIWNTHTRLPKHSWAFEYTDLLLGLILGYELTREKRYLTLFDKVLAFVQKTFIRRNVIHSHYFSFLGGCVPVTSAICGMYCEVLCDAYRLTNEKKYLDFAQAYMAKFLSQKGFVSHGLFATYHVTKPLLRFLSAPLSLAHQYDLTKYNSTISQALLSLFEITKDERYALAYKQWFTGLQKHLRYPQGGYAKQVVIRSSSKKRGTPELMDFHILESLCDAYHILGDDVYLTEAKDLARFWLSKQGKTGLLPYRLGEKASFFDAEVDFVIGLGKLFELTQDDYYREKANEIVDALLKYHVQDYGFSTAVDVDTGNLLNAEIDTRFLTLFFKLSLLYENDFLTYKKKKICSLLRDR